MASMNADQTCTDATPGSGQLRRVRQTRPPSLLRREKKSGKRPGCRHSRKRVLLASLRADASIVSPGSTLPPKPLK